MSESKWIEFDLHKQDPKRKTRRWTVNTKDGQHCLGNIEWFGRWRGYAFSPVINTFTYFEKTCLRDIANFIEEANKFYKQNKL